ncbi:sec1 family domain-containing protein 2-like isoform X2 [Cherax quadricarinatus]|uniref:sec1 family domain-containing protein 2-like isoform X2 n=1 Tax=Cherax quadricarinatus TaxID=27406 RepID=UPI00387EE844
MQAANAIHVSEAWWIEACKKVKNAVVFLDNNTAECLHWSGGLTRLVNAGAKNVKEFSSFESGNKDDIKAVFMVSTALRDTTTIVLQDIIKASRFQYCIIITCAHPSVHAYARYGGREVDESLLMSELEQDILSWMGNMNYTIEIFYNPLVIAPYSEKLFFMPTFSKLYPLLNSDVLRISKLQQALPKGDKMKPVENLGEVEFHHLPFEMRILVRQFVVCIHSLLQGMNAREEVYTVGHTSRIIGTELDTFNPARQRRKTASNKVSLVLIDRTLDLVVASSHRAEPLMGRILSLLPRLYDHQLDSAVSMAPLCKVHPSSEWTLVPGCLAPQGKEIRASAVLNSLVMSSGKEALSLINKYVLEAASHKNLASEPEKKEARVTPENLKKNIQQFASDIDAFTENAGLLQQGLGVVETLCDPRYVHLDQLLSLEKRLLQSIGDPEETLPFTQIFQLLKTRGTHGVTLDDILTLMVYVASLGGPDVFTHKDEYALTNRLSHAIVEDKKLLSDVLLQLVGQEVDEVSALRSAQCIAEQLHAIASARDHLKNYKHLHIPGDSAQPASYQSLLQKLVYDCLTAPQAEITDLEYKSAGFKDLIKTGFSLFVNVSKPMPRDTPTMLVFVVGGVTPGEVFEIQQVVTAVNPPCEVIVASTHFAHPTDSVINALQPNPFLRHV